MQRAEAGEAWDRAPGLDTGRGLGSSLSPGLTVPFLRPVRALQGLRGPHGQPRAEHGAPGPRCAGRDPGPAGVLHEGTGHPPAPPARRPGALAPTVPSPHPPCLPPTHTHLSTLPEGAWPMAGGSLGAGGQWKLGWGPQTPLRYAMPSLCNVCAWPAGDGASEDSALISRPHGPNPGSWRVQVVGVRFQAPALLMSP